jgi:hypothetical protein
MTDSNNMYGANLKEYALDVLRNKQIVRSTYTNWQVVTGPSGIPSSQLSSFHCC